MANDEQCLVDELSAEIEVYLESHPDAADTFEGIAQWWIVHQRFLRGLSALEAALIRLDAAGKIERVRCPDGRTLYRRPAPD